MNATSNSTTARLEAYARARGLGVGVLKSAGNSAGLFFVVAIDSKPLSRWISLGWSVAEAREALQRLAAGEALAPSRTGYSFSV